MTRIGLVLVYVASVIMCSIPAGAQQSQGGLIRVKPAYQEATYVPQQEARHDEAVPAGPPPPSPRDQLYVFWLVGKILSYPVDKMEAFITSKWQNFQKPALRPASAPASEVQAVNPFDTIDTSEIPPAPPALGGAAPKNR
ncbi:MAG: hypothetical protein LDL33_08540 [Desulfomonile sp.]|nr:hypothetical protein [Desulfomonile sp.]